MLSIWTRPNFCHMVKSETKNCVAFYSPYQKLKYNAPFTDIDMENIFGKIETV